MGRAWLGKPIPRRGNWGSDRFYIIRDKNLEKNTIGGAGLYGFRIDPINYPKGEVFCFRRESGGPKETPLLLGQPDRFLKKKVEGCRRVFPNFASQKTGGKRYTPRGEKKSVHKGKLEEGGKGKRWTQKKKGNVF